jgi:hypothetical protein
VALHPKAQLSAALDCLRGADARARGTALEYVETLLPFSMRKGVMPFLENAFPLTTERVAPPSAAEAETLRRSQETVRVSLAEIRRATKQA